MRATQYHNECVTSTYATACFDTLHPQRGKKLTSSVSHEWEQSCSLVKGRISAATCRIVAGDVFDTIVMESWRTLIPQLDVRPKRLLEVETSSKKVLECSRLANECPEIPASATICALGGTRAII